MAWVRLARCGGGFAARLAIHSRSSLRDTLEQAAEIKRVLKADQVSDAFHLGVGVGEVFTRLGNLLSVEKTSRALTGVLAELLGEIGVGHTGAGRQLVDAHVSAEVFAHHCERALDPGRR